MPIQFLSPISLFFFSNQNVLFRQRNDVCLHGVITYKFVFSLLDFCFPISKVSGLRVLSSVCLLMVAMAGIMFQDITTLLLDPKAFKDTIDLFVERYKGKNISVVAGKRE